jgi:glycosyltransferase involved in cell wall biosynthesis
LSLHLSDDWDLFVTVVERDGVLNIPARVKELHVPRLSEFANGLIAIPTMIAAMRCDYLLLSADPVTAIAGTPTLAIVHDLPELIASASGQEMNSVRRWIERAKKFLRGRMLRKCAVVVCNSHFTATQAIQAYGISAERIRIGYCGIDERFYERPKVSVADWIGISRPYLLVFATGDARERYDLCPAIFSAIRAAVPELTLVIAGIDVTGSYTIGLRRDLEARGIVVGCDVHFVPFLGEVEFDKLHALYHDAAYYLELSGHEGFGMSLAEAMACGTACISSGAGALDEIGGGFPIRVTEHTATAFADAVVQAYRRGIHLNRNVAQVQFSRRYSWSAVGRLIGDELAILHGRLGEAERAATRC